MSAAALFSSTKRDLCSLSNIILDLLKTNLVFCHKNRTHLKQKDDLKLGKGSEINIYLKYLPDDTKFNWCMPNNPNSLKLYKH